MDTAPRTGLSDRTTHLAATVRRIPWRRLGAALVASVLGALAALVVMVALRLLVGAATLPELVAERLLPLLNTDQFISLLLRFSPNSKTAPLGLTLLGQFVVGTLAGMAYCGLAERLDPPKRDAAHRFPGGRAWLLAAAFAGGMWLLGAAIFWPVLEGNVYGDLPTTARALTLLAMLLTFAAFAAVTALCWHGLVRVWDVPEVALPTVRTENGSGRLTRRRALVAGASALAGAVVGALALRGLIGSYLARSNLTYEGHGAPAPNPSQLTANDEFYVVSKNVLDPQVDPSRWHLDVNGLVVRPYSLGSGDLAGLPAETRAITLECISNEIDGHLMSTAIWRGTSLSALLDRAGGVKPEGRWVVFHAADGFATSLPLAELLAVRTLLAWEMNGVPLPQRHGFPLRALVPGHYGEQSAKWVTRIEVVENEYKGFYQSQGWSPAPVPTVSRIDAPAAGMVAKGRMTVSGTAYGGARGIRGVEVSADGGATWHAAILTPPLSDQTWVLWRWDWTPPSAGAYELVVRATDGTGARQIETSRGTVPSGATGLHRVRVQVVA